MTIAQRGYGAIQVNTDLIPDIISETDKIDKLPASGINGTPGSLSYIVHMILCHHHAWERGFGKAAVPNGQLHVADRFGLNNGSFQLNAGSNTWGSWLQLLGSNDTPVQANMVYYELNRVSVTAAQRTDTYYVQIGFGTSGADSLAAGTYTEFAFTPQSVPGKPDEIIIMNKSVNYGTKCWARCMCPGQPSGTINILIGIHEYPG